MALDDAAPVHRFRRPVRRSGPAAARHARRGWSCWRSTRRISTRAPAIPIWRSGRAGLAGQRRALRRPGARRRRASPKARSTTSSLDIVHAHDWQAGLALAYLHYRGGKRPGTVMTVHNLAFQGLFPAALLPALGLPPAAFSIDGVEFHGMINFLKAGLVFADRHHHGLADLRRGDPHPEGGMGLDGLLRARAPVLSGILNGIDDGGVGPRHRPVHRRRVLRCRGCAGGAANKPALQARFGLAPRPDALLFGVISRLTAQKGLDLLLADLDLPLAAWRPARPARRRRARAGGRLRRRRRGASAADRLRASAMTRRWPTRSRPAPTPSWCPRASSPAA